MLRNALRNLGDAPRRSIEELKQRLALESAALTDANSPLFAMMEPSDESHVPTMTLNRKAAIAARRSSTR